MSQNYNINMKKFNGTDYDGLLPLAYNALNSQQLDGKTFNEIQNLFEDLVVNFSYFSYGSYKGTNTYGPRYPNSIQFSFNPKLFFLYSIKQVNSNFGVYTTALVPCVGLSAQYNNDSVDRISVGLPYDVSSLSSTFSNKQQFSAYGNYNPSYGFFSRKQNNCLYWYVNNPARSSYQPRDQFNESNITYVYYAFG